MIRINLLPFRAARTKENIRRQISVFFLSMILLALILSAGNMYLGNRVEALENRLSHIRQEIARYEEKARQVEIFRKELAELNKKIDIVNQLKSHRKEPPLLLAELTDLVVPGQMQIQKMRYNGKTLAIDGLAMDNETIAVFMRRLERSERIGEVNLVSAKQRVQYEVEMKDFGINCTVAGSKAGAGKEAKK